MADATPSNDLTALAAPLSPRHREALHQFILLWGEMATHWGINRTMAQIHALLYASEQPLDTDEIMDRLQISRGNANMNLRSLVEWNLVRKIHQLGSRKDYYTAEKDVWKICSTVIEERRKREVKPVMAALQDTTGTLRDEDPLDPAEAQFAERIDNLVEFLEVFEGFTSALIPFVQQRNAGKVRRLVQFASRLRKGDPADTEP